jgi:hypothetical protein
MLCEIATRTYLFRPYNSKDTSFFVRCSIKTNAKKPTKSFIGRWTGEYKALV